MPSSIDAIRAAKDRVAGFDKRIADLTQQLREVKAERRAAWSELDDAVDVAIGRGTPTLPFDDASEPSAEAARDRARRQGLGLIAGFPPGVLKKLLGHGGVRTVGELWDWVDEDGALDGGMADPNGVGLFGCLRGIGVSAALATEASDRLYAFLTSAGCDPRANANGPSRRSPIEALVDQACGVGPPSGPAAPVAARPESINVLGLLAADLDRASVLSAFLDRPSKLKKPPAVRPVTVGGALYVAAGKLYHGAADPEYPGGESWTLLPLLDPAAFVAAHKRGVRLHPGHDGDLEHYTGVRVAVAGREYVIGPRGLRRQVVKPAAAAPGPVVCLPVGALPLRRVGGFPVDVADACEAAGVATLADLEAMADEVRRSQANPAHYAADSRPVHEALRRIPGVRDMPTLAVAGDAVIDHLFAAGVGRPTDPPAKPGPAAPKRARRKREAG